MDTYKHSHNAVFDDSVAADVQGTTPDDIVASATPATTSAVAPGAAPDDSVAAEVQGAAPDDSVAVDVQGAAPDNSVTAKVQGAAPDDSVTSPTPVVAPVTSPVASLVASPAASPVVAPVVVPVVAPDVAPIVPAEPSTSAAAAAAAPVTASNNDDATAPLAKRPRVSVFRDSVGREVTSASLAGVTDRFPYMTLSTLCALYFKVTGHQLVPEGSDSRHVLQDLGELEGYRLQSIRITSIDLNEAASFDVIGRGGQEFAAMRRNIQTRLGLAEGPIRPIPAPLLCYQLVMLACIPVNQMTGIKLDWMFQKMTGQGLRSLSVVSRNGVQQLTENAICAMVQTWVHNLCRFVSKGHRAGWSLRMAKTCHKKYAMACDSDRERHSHLDLRGAVAGGLLAENLWCSRVFLGIREAELQRLYKYLPYIMNERADEDKRRYLREVSDSLFTPL